MTTYRRQIKYKIYPTDTEDQILGKILIMHAQEMADEINYALAKKQLEAAKVICKYAFDYFYNGYKKPHLYNRTEGMRDIVQIGIRNNEDFIFEIGPEYMGSHESGTRRKGGSMSANEAIYYLDFMQGYHGGRRWRTPTPTAIALNGPHEVLTADGMQLATHSWQYWHPDEVPITEPSPYKLINTNWNNYLDNRYPGQKTAIIRNVWRKYLRGVR